MKKYYLGLLVGIGVLLVPHLSFAAIQIDNTKNFGYGINPIGGDFLITSSSPNAVVIFSIKDYSGGHQGVIECDVTGSPATFEGSSTSPSHLGGDIYMYAYATTTSGTVYPQCSGNGPDPYFTLVVSDYTGASLPNASAIQQATLGIGDTTFQVSVPTVNSWLVAAVGQQGNGSCNTNCRIGNVAATDIYDSSSTVGTGVQNLNVGSSWGAYGSVLVALPPFSGGGGGSSSTISFINPVQGTSTILFDNFLLAVTNVSSSQRCSISGSWFLPLRQLTVPFGISPTPCDVLVSDGFMPVFAANFPNISNSNLVDVPVNAYASLYVDGVLTASTSVDFNILSQNNVTSSIILHIIPVATSSGQLYTTATSSYANPFTPNAGSTACNTGANASIWSIDDWFCAINGFVGDFFNPVYANLDSAVILHSMQTSFPFTLYFGFVDAVKLAASVYSVSDASSTLALSNYPIDASTSLTVVVLSSSTTAQAFGHSDFQVQLLLWEGYVMYFLLTIVIVATILIFFRAY